MLLIDDHAFHITIQMIDYCISVMGYTHWLVGWLVNRVVGWLVGQLVGWLIYNLRNQQT
jgi:hypothetical protein